MSLVAEEVEKLWADARRDLVGRRREALFSLPSFLLSRLAPSLRDARDVPALTLLFNICTTSLPLCAALIATRCQSKLLLASYLLAHYVLYLQRFMLTLHVTSHRPLFAKHSGTWRMRVMRERFDT